MAKFPKSRISAGIGASSLWISFCLPAVRLTPHSRRWNACPENSERIRHGPQFLLTGRVSSESNRLGRVAWRGACRFARFPGWREAARCGLEITDGQRGERQLAHGHIVLGYGGRNGEPRAD